MTRDAEQPASANRCGKRPEGLALERGFTPVRLFRASEKTNEPQGKFTAQVLLKRKSSAKRKRPVRSAKDGDDDTA